MEFQNKSVRGYDGLELNILEWSSSGVPLVLLHGFGNNAHIWDDLVPIVAPYYRTMALDLRGHGDSEHDPDLRYDYTYHLSDLDCLTESLQIDRLVLIGHSLGGRISILFASTHIEKMAGLVLVDIGPELDPRGVSRIKLETSRSRKSVFKSVEEYKYRLARLYPGAHSRILERMANYGVRKREDGLYEHKTDARFLNFLEKISEEEQENRSNLLSHALWEALSKITCPTLVVRGAASDVLDPTVAERMTEDVLPDGHLAIVENAGHSVMTDNPEGFIKALEAFTLESH